MSLVGSDHQSRASAFVHRVDLGAVAKHQLKSGDVLCKRGGVQRSPARAQKTSVLVLPAQSGSPMSPGTDTVWQPHRPLASLVLIMDTPADSSSLSAATLWPFILHENSGERFPLGSMTCYDVCFRERSEAAAEGILTEHSAGG